MATGEEERLRLAETVCVRLFVYDSPLNLASPFGVLDSVIVVQADEKSIESTIEECGIDLYCYSIAVPCIRRHLLRYLRC